MDGAILAERTGVLLDRKSERPDILVLGEAANPVAVETEWGDPAEADARARLGQRVAANNLLVRSAVAVGIDDGIRSLPAAQVADGIGSVELRFRVLTADDDPASMAVWPANGHITGTAADLAALCEYAAAPHAVVERRARAVAAEVRAIGNGLHASLTPKARREVAARSGQKNAEQAVRMAACIWLTALRLQDELALRSEALQDDLLSLRLVREEGNGLVTAAATRREWAKVLAVNYGAIFESAQSLLAIDMPAGAIADALTGLAEIADSIAAERLGARIDFAGELFPLLLDDREETAAHYTLPVTAELLAGLAVDRLPVDWADADAARAVRFADMACGTGSLLRIAYWNIRRKHEAAGGRGADLHRTLMENGITGIDINPLAAHMTAAGLSIADTGVHYDRSAIVASRLDRGGIGSLHLLRDNQIADMFGQQSRSAAARDRANVSVPEGSQHLVIQNPPYQRPRKDRSMFDVAGSDAASRAASGRLLRSARQALSAQSGRTPRTTRGDAGRMLNGQAGHGADFSALAHLKLRDGGVFASVLPLTAARAESWAGVRTVIEERYDDIAAVAFGGMMSADTNMREMLLVATRRAQPRPDGERAGVLCVNLDPPPATALDAWWCARQIGRAAADGRTAGLVRRGGDVIGSWVRTKAQRGFPWFAVGIADHLLADAMSRLLDGEVWSPSDGGHRMAIPMTTLGQIAGIGPTHDLIGHPSGGDGRGAFRLDPVGAVARVDYPALWAADAAAQTRIAVRPTHAGEQVGDEAKVRQQLAQRGDLFVSRTLRMTSQALAAARTDEAVMGGRAWTALISDDDAVKSALALWLNSTLGLVLRTGYAQTTQPGRATLSIDAFGAFPVPDFAASEHARAVARREYGRLAAGELLPAASAWQDTHRQAIDGAVLDMIGLGRNEGAAAAVRRLRDKWAREPAVHGGNRALVEALE